MELSMSDQISIKKGEKIVIPLVFKKRVVLNNTIDSEKLSKLTDVVKRIENIQILKPENN